ncbi:MAG: beta-glucanase, partial [Bacteroidota bacterium]
MTTRLHFSLLLVVVSFCCLAQSVQDDFDGNSNINSWFGDNCQIALGVTNPFPTDLNPSAQVMSYQDVGGTFANVRFEIPTTF